MPVDGGTPEAATGQRLFLWLHNTARQPLETGIQRVSRRLGRGLQGCGLDVVAVGRDERSGLIEVIGRGVAAFEAALAETGASPLLLIPELTADLVARGLDPACMGKAHGMRTLTVLHDTIPLKLREHYAAPALAMFEAYYESFARTDAVLATTTVVADELRRFLEDRALRVPPIAVVPLPAQFGHRPRVAEDPPVRRAGEPLRLAALVSWERRKNLPRLLRALARAQRDAAISLTLIGRRGFDEAHDAEVGALLAAATGVDAAGALPDEAVAARVAASHATVYPSYEEGFGLPVGESLWLGRPCLCHDGSAMAVLAPGGGTLTVDMTDEAAIAAALVAMARDPGMLDRLGAEARARPLASWTDYAAEVAGRFGPVTASGDGP